LSEGGEDGQGGGGFAATGAIACDDQRHETELSRGKQLL
jgi:hypothetical protein